MPIAGTLIVPLVKPNARLSFLIISLSLLILFSFATFGSAQADDSIEVTSKATDVTVFPDGARVQRAATVSVPAGHSKVVIRDLPVSLNDASLRVKGEAVEPIQISSIESRVGHSEQLAGKKEQELQDTITELRDKRKRADVNISAAQQQISFIASLSKNKGSFWNEATSIEMLEKALTVINDGTTDAHVKILQAQRVKRKLDHKIGKLERELNQIASGQKASRIVTVNLVASAATDANLYLEYDLSNAGWQPLYDLRLDTTKEADSLTIDQLAEVTQNTCEDWIDVAITLSTARVATNTQAPSLDTWFLYAYENKPKAKRSKSLSGTAYESSPSLVSSMMVGDQSVSMAEPMAPVPVTVNLTGFDVTFAVPGKNSIPSDRQPHKFNISKQDYAVDLFNKVVPKADETAYLVAELTNVSEVPLLPGRMSLYRDGAFVGTGHLPGLQTNEEAELSFGANDSIKVNYRLLEQEKSQGGIISVTNSRERAFQIDVQNLFNQSQRIKIYDQLPVSTDEDITVQEMSGSTRPTERDVDEIKGVVVWDDSYEAGEERQINFVYKVSFPEGKQIPGFE